MEIKYKRGDYLTPVHDLLDIMEVLGHTPRGDKYIMRYLRGGEGTVLSKREWVEKEYKKIGTDKVDAIRLLYGKNG